MRIKVCDSASGGCGAVFETEKAEGKEPRVILSRCPECEQRFDEKMATQPEVDEVQ